MKKYKVGYEHIRVTLPAKLVQAVERFAVNKGLKRSAAVSMLLTLSPDLKSWREEVGEGSTD